MHELSIVEAMVSADLFFMRLVAQVRCRNCREQKVEIISGRELYIDSLEVE